VTTTLLAVDDSKTMRKVLEITFSGEDYRTLAAGSGEEALGKLRSERPAVALVDANLGAESGYDLCRKIKQEAPGVGVILLSSKHQPYDKGRGDSAGADDHIDKPFDTQQLIDKVGALVRRLAAAPRAAAAPIATAHPAPSPAASAVARPRAATLTYGAPGQAGAPQTSVRTATMPGAGMPQVSARPVPVAAPAPAPAPAPPPVAAQRAPTPVTGVHLGGRAAPAAAPAPAPAAVPAVAAAAVDGNFADRLAGLGLTREQVQGVLALSREVVEQVVWEVVPVLAETLIKEEIKRLTSE
jgi:CheY-like chemotaxis protein